ncbi:unnamed protein product [Umbelopsis vinacea]
MTDDGYILVKEIVCVGPKLKDYTFEDVKYVVDTNDKQRFRMQQDQDGFWWIRANQGHSLKTVKVELDLIQTPLPFITSQDGIIFQLSSNQVVLSEGVNGILAPKYFSKVVNRDGQSLLN